MPAEHRLSDPVGALLGDLPAFGSETFGRQVQRRPATGAEALLGLDDVDHLLADTALRAPAFRLVREGAPIPAARYTRTARIGSRTVPDLADVAAVHRLVGEGATLVLQGLHRYWPPVTAACAALEDALGHPVQANAYLTPPVATGLHIHGDPHDVLAVQTWGRKRWQVWPPGTDPGDPGDPVLDDDLVPGDALYLPTGTPHAPRTVDAASLHLTVGIRARTMDELVRDAVEAAVGDAGATDAPLPAGWHRRPETLDADLAARLERVAAALTAQDPGTLTARAARRAHASRPVRRRGGLTVLLDPDALADDTPLERVPGAIRRVAEGDGRVELVLGDRRLRMPDRAAPAVRAVAERDALTPGDLRAHLDAPSRLVLARRLVREGVLRPARRPGTA